MVVLGALVAARVGAVVLGVSVAPGDKALIMVTQEQQYGLPHSLPLARPAQA